MMVTEMEEAAERRRDVNGVVIPTVATEAGNEVGARRGNNNRLTLAPNLRMIQAFWQEYEHGIGGRKPAKLFTRQERGIRRFLYSKRKLVWDKISLLVRQGYGWEAACDSIYAAYGRNLSIAQIMRQIQVDNRLPVENRRLRV